MIGTGAGDAPDPFAAAATWRPEDDPVEEVERALLGVLLLSRQSRLELLGDLDAGLFTVDAHGDLLAVLQATPEPVDPVVVAQEADRRGIRAFIPDLVAAPLTWSVACGRRYLQVLQEEAERRRRIGELLGELADLDVDVEVEQ